ncbi:hypothetical protein [Legionella sp. PC997]|uniref:hypothetical protein n=1 Tax=Legionella sp. PC997 TaxID=2755562 RepID=UPI0015F7F36C|nr:hypothetical protein [Legionella sp. PC997]QMT61384.1 hypothetical protein HBNCFIEN_02779 [Legionella sp. PC997]
MTNIVIELFESIKYLVFKKNNITLYYNGFNDLLNLMEMALALDKDEHCIFTYVVDHGTEETNKLKYHEGINATYSDEGHYHFERKDKGKITVKDIIQLLDYLVKYNLLNEREKSEVIIRFCDQKQAQRKLSIFSHIRDEESVSSNKPMTHPN